MRGFVAFPLLAACSAPPTLDGKVVDIWGEPIEGATVMMIGQTERPLTDAEGRYALPRVEGKHLVKAGREGYIQDHEEVEVSASGTAPGPLFQLFPKPKEAGYYLVSTGDYVPLEPQLVVSVGNELRAHRGLKSVGEARTDNPRLRVILHSELKLDEILRLGLELHKLEFVRDTELQGPLSKQKVTVNLYSSEREVQIDITPLRSPTDYLITAKDPVEPGYYAFQTQDLLDGLDGARFNQIPEDLRAVHPFEVR